MASTETGRGAEAMAAAYLRGHGFSIREQNWRTRYCEIDIVAEKGGTIYFIEVKYRRTANQGKGLDYITPKKLKQMKFAAEMWVQMHKWRGDCDLGAVGIDGDAVEFVEALNT